MRRDWVVRYAGTEHEPPRVSEPTDCASAVRLGRRLVDTGHRVVVVEKLPREHS